MIRMGVSLILMGMALAARAEPRSAGILQIPVKAVSGRVLAWSPWSSDWTPIEVGTTLREGSLIQVPSGGSVTFTLSGRNGFKDLSADEIDITLKKPTIVRLSSDVLRRIQLNTYFIPQLPDVQQAEGGSSDPLYHSFTEGWERFAALVMPGAVKKSWLSSAEQEKTQDKEDTSLAIRSKRIKLFTPKSDTMLLVDHFPANLTVLWEPIPDPSVRYDVMIWKIDEPRRPPLATTRFDYHFAKIFSQGTYYVQVGSADGRYQSKVAQVNVTLPMEDENERGLASKKDGSERKIDLVFPPENFQYSVNKMPMALTFDWSAKRRSDTTYELVILDLQGKELTRRKTDEGQLRLKINQPGQYRWRVEALASTVRNPSDQKIYSETRAFSLAQVKPSLDLLIQAKKSGVTYLETSPF